VQACASRMGKRGRHKGSTVLVTQFNPRPRRTLRRPAAPMERGEEPAAQTRHLLSVCKPRVAESKTDRMSAKNAFSRLRRCVGRSLRRLTRTVLRVVSWKRPDIHNPLVPRDEMSTVIRDSLSRTVRQRRDGRSASLSTATAGRR
jgi:hypothetical protein